MLRLDTIHKHWSGNKYFKLKFNLEEARKQNKTTLLTFGGAYSNHIAATAAAGKENGFETIGIIRGEKHEPLNPTLQFASDCGMQLHYVSREVYKTKSTPEFNNSLTQQFNNFYLIPEGGSNLLAVKGCSEILNSVEEKFDFVCCACGTGTTLAGLILSLNKNQKAIGFSSLKGGEFLVDDIQKQLNNYSLHYSKTIAFADNWSVNSDYHFGGYAKTTEQLIAFKKDFEAQQNIELDYVYTSKMMFGIFDLIAKRHFPEGSKILAIHTGGIQGNKGFEK